MAAFGVKMVTKYNNAGIDLRLFVTDPNHASFTRLGILEKSQVEKVWFGKNLIG